MTPKEAKEELKFNKSLYETEICHAGDGTPDGDLMQALDMAIETLGKQIPKKPILEPWSPAICPSCGEELSGSLGDGYYKHYIHLERCPNIECSQRLDWSEGE